MRASRTHQNRQWQCRKRERSDTCRQFSDRFDWFKIERGNKSWKSLFSGARTASTFRFILFSVQRPFHRYKQKSRSHVVVKSIAVFVTQFTIDFDIEKLQSLLIKSNWIIKVRFVSVHNWMHFAWLKWNEKFRCSRQRQWSQWFNLHLFFLLSSCLNMFTRSLIHTHL